MYLAVNCESLNECVSKRSLTFVAHTIDFATAQPESSAGNFDAYSIR